MSRGESGETLPPDELAELVASLSPDLRVLFARYCVGEEAAEEIVFEAMMALARRWHDLPDRKRWFLEAVEHACAREGTAPTSESN